MYQAVVFWVDFLDRDVKFAVEEVTELDEEKSICETEIAQRLSVWYLPAQVNIFNEGRHHTAACSAEY
jgi:hypothetical protein